MLRVHGDWSWVQENSVEYGGINSFHQNYSTKKATHYHFKWMIITFEMAFIV